MAGSITGVKKVDMLIGVSAKSAGKAVQTLLAQRETVNADEVSLYYSTDFPNGGRAPDVAPERPVAREDLAALLELLPRPPLRELQTVPLPDQVPSRVKSLENRTGDLEEGVEKILVRFREVSRPRILQVDHRRHAIADPYRHA